MKIDLAYKTSK